MLIDPAISNHSRGDGVIGSSIAALSLFAKAALRTLDERGCLWRGDESEPVCVEFSRVGDAGDGGEIREVVADGFDVVHWYTPVK